MTKIKQDFLDNFWEWFEDYHRNRYRKEGKILVPEFKYHQKHMKFDNYVWEWVAIFVKENYEKKQKAEGESK